VRALVVTTQHIREALVVEYLGPSAPTMPTA
jgi:hypothetical protein